MTGYGQAQGRIGGVTYSVEIKTVNNRYFKTAIRVPDAAAFLEGDIEKLLRENIGRGTVNYILRLKEVAPEVLFEIDERALQSVVDKLSRVAGSADTKATIDVGGLLNLPGIVVPPSPDEKTVEQIKQAVISITQQALDNLKKMRAAEGAALAVDLDSHRKAIKQALEQIRARNDVVLKEYQAKLKKRVDELLGELNLKLDDSTLAREVAVFADRSDISEEIARLKYHLEQFAESCQTNTQAGRKLEFIGQEMLREANTIASKASDSEIASCVIDIKCRIDRIKEQVQNVE